MKIKLFVSILLSFTLLATLTTFTACNNKNSDSTPSYMRGGNSLLVGSDGNLIIAGYNSSSTKGYQAALLKVNATTGDTIWSKMYGGTYSDAFFNVNHSKAGGYIATGFSNRVNGGSPQMVVLITDAAGNQLKSVAYGSSAYSEGFSIISNADSGYLVAGFKQLTSASDRDLYLVRIRDDGTVIWDKTIGAKSSNNYDNVNDAAYGVISAPDGGYFLTGEINGGVNMEGGEIFLMKVSASGDSLWTKTYGTGFGYSLTLTSDGNIAIDGSILNGTDQNAFLLKTDLNGNLLWPAAKTFGGTGYQYGASMIQTADGGFAITGITEESDGYGSQDVYLILTNSTGDNRNGSPFRYGKSDLDQGYGIVQTTNNDLYFTGLSNSGGSFIFLNHTDVNGGQASGWPKYID